MNSLESESIYKLMMEHKFKLDHDSFTENLQCSMCRELMVDACLTPCGCQYCYKCIKDFLGDEAKYCQGQTVKCGQQRITINADVFRNEKLNCRIRKKKVQCPAGSCSAVIRLDEMEKHLQTGSNKPMKCPFAVIGCNNDGESEIAIIHHINDGTLLHSQLLTSFITNMKNEMDGLMKKYELTQATLNELLQDSRIDQLKDDLEIGKKEIKKEDVKIIGATAKEKEEKNEKNIAKKIEAIQTKVVDSVNDIGSLQSIVTKIKKRINHSIYFTIDRFRILKKSNDVIVSPSFYSWINGYELRLEFRPGGYGKTKGTHVSIFFGINKGKHDDLLQWPFKNSVKISLINQTNNATHMKRIFKYENTESKLAHMYDKPCERNNIACGTVSFISHEELEAAMGLVVNDTVLFSCSVDPF